MRMIQVVKAIQILKAKQLSFAQVQVEERQQILRRMKEYWSGQSLQVFAWEAERGFVTDYELFLQHCFNPGLEAIDRAIEELGARRLEQTTFYPTGVVSIILPSTFIFRTLLERLAPAIGGGNLILVKLSSKGHDCSREIEEVLLKAGLPEGVCQLLFGSGEDIGELMSSHPAIQAVSYAGSFVTAEKVLKQSLALGRKLQVSAPGNNSAILLGDHLPPADQLQLLAKACFAHGGALPWSIKKIFLKEDLLKSFVTVFSQITAELFPNSQIGSAEQSWIVSELSHCSSLQQDEICRPLALISGVKYPADAVKWANVGYLSVGALILGESSQALRLAEKLEVGQVWINSWLGSGESRILGVKQSFFGDRSFEVFGSFYSNCRKIVRP